MDVALQWIGGCCYLLNKIFLSRTERLGKEDAIASRRWRIAAWVVYLLGLPAWMILLIGRHDWIVALVEASGAPAMLLGLVMAVRGDSHNPPRWLDRTALVCIPFGFVYSVYDFGGFTAGSQWLEIALVVGFLIGTYQLARQRASGYGWYVLMHLACAWLMGIQGYPWLLLQQLVSLGFILDAYRAQRRSPTLVATSA